MKADFATNLNRILFILILFLNLMIKFNHPAWEGFYDPYDYLRQSKISLADKEFYFPHRVGDFDPRPFTVPLFYKIAGSDANMIVIMQKFFHTLATWFLAFALLFYIQRKYLRITIVVFIYLFTSWWNILGWANLLLSESLSITFLFLWIASFLILYKKRNTWTISLHILIAVLFSFTRDSWPYILIIFYTLFLFYQWIQKKKKVHFAAAMLLLSIGIFFIQQHSAKIGKRYRLPIMNTIVVRILPNDSYTEWFVRNGMPCAGKLKTEYQGTIADDPKIYNLYNDPDYQEFFNWIDSQGQKTYTRFILTHPGYFLLFHESKEGRGRIFSYMLKNTAGIYGYSHASTAVFPVFNLILIIFLNAILIFFFLKRKNFIFFYPVALTIITSCNALLIYNADALEVERHMVFTNILIQLIGIVSVFVILDNISFSKAVKTIFSRYNILHSAR